jgi:hypothetical protein
VESYYAKTIFKATVDLNKKQLFRVEVVKNGRIILINSFLDYLEEDLLFLYRLETRRIRVTVVGGIVFRLKFSTFSALNKQVSFLILE